jgi:hypothetical protein
MFGFSQLRNSCMFILVRINIPKQTVNMFVIC